MKLACEIKFFQNSIMAGRLRHFQRIIGEANKRGFGILSTRKNLRSGSRPKTEILRECSHTPYACFSITTPERKGGEGTDVTKFEIVWLKAQSLRRIESSNATNSLKLTDRMEGFFGPKEKANQQHHHTTTSDRGHRPLSFT